jgi:hypothetical protein
MDLAEQARLLRLQLAQRTGHASAPLITQVVAHVAARRHAGDSMLHIAQDLELGVDTLYRWRRETPALPALRPVQVLASSPSTLLTVHGPGGLRLEGLTLEQVAQLWKRLA